MKTRSLGAIAKAPHLPNRMLAKTALTRVALLVEPARDPISWTSKLLDRICSLNAGEPGLELVHDLWDALTRGENPRSDANRAGVGQLRPSARSGFVRAAELQGWVWV
jgi:hypothetical protein